MLHCPRHGFEPHHRTKHGDISGVSVAKYTAKLRHAICEQIPELRRCVPHYGRNRDVPLQAPPSLSGQTLPAPSPTQSTTYQALEQVILRPRHI